jgi:hypothetical protein
MQIAWRANPLEITGLFCSTKPRVLEPLGFLFALNSIRKEVAVPAKEVLGIPRINQLLKKEG